MTFFYKVVTVIIIAPIRSLFSDMVFTGAFAVALGITVLAEYWWPAEERQRRFGAAFYQDLVWFLYETILHAAVIVTYVSWLNRSYGRCCADLTITAAQIWPAWARFLVGFLMLDLLYWVQHYVNHRIPILWEFHKLHHSQTELNFFSDFRYHVVEYLVRHTVLSIPFLLLSVPVPTIVGLSVVLRFYSRFYHGNIRTNLGPLRFLLVTPQSHRVHHSVESQHFDKNYGAILSVWDRLFGTQYPLENEYPRTGIADHAFPLEKSRSPGGLLWRPVAQLLYPFKSLLRGAWKARRSRSEER